MKFTGKVAVVTGGGSGMGRELVLGLIDRGATVAAVDINEKNLKETELLISPADRIRFSSHILNIGDMQDVEDVVPYIISLHGNVDILFNNAGIVQPFVKINDLSLEAVERVIKVDLMGPIFMTKAFLPHFLHRPEAHIVNTSSMGGFLPVPGQAIYGAAKAGVKLMTEALYAELLDTNVHVTLVYPGAIATNIATNSGLKMPANAEEVAKDFKPMSAVKAASIILNAVEKNKYRVLVGSDSSFMDKLTRLNPQYATRFIAKKMMALLNN